MLDAGIGGDATAFLMDSQAMPVALFELKGAKPDAKQRFMEIVEGEAARLAADEFRATCWRRRSPSYRLSCANATAAWPMA